MNTLYLLIILFQGLWISANQNSKVMLKLDNQQQEKSKLLIGLISPQESMQRIAAVIQDDLTCDLQKLSGFAPEIESFDRVPSKSAFKKYTQKGYPIIAFLQENDVHFELRIYDSLYAQMLLGKKITKKSSPESIAHHLSDALWKTLTGQEGIFSTKIAYCKEFIQNKHTGSNIYCATPHGKDNQCLIEGGKLIAPRWNKNQTHPLLSYSEITPSNVRLMVSDLHGKKRIVSNFEGLTMLPDVSMNGQKAVYCGTKDGNSQIYMCTIDPQTKKRTIVNKTNNKGNNTSPNLRENGDIIFCSDFETKMPQLYYLHHENNQLERLKVSGYCACPHFSEKKEQIIYCSVINKVMQVFAYDLKNTTYKQLTFSSGNKDECCWSPCANYIMYSVDSAKTSRIALLNLLTNEETFITSSNERCTYPTWSPSLW